MLYTRREVGKLALASVALPSVLGARGLQKPNSKIHGVQIGAITYSYQTIPDVNVIIQTMAKHGFSEAEVMWNHIEALAGAPAAPPRAPRVGGGRGRGGAPGAPAAAAPAQPQGPTPEEIAARQAAQAAQTAYDTAIAQWRAAATPAMFKTARKKFNDAGIEVRFLCYNLPSSIKDEELEYAFNMAKALGVSAMSTTTQVSMAKRIAPFAEKHKVLVAFHGHDQTTNPDEISSPATFTAVTAASKYHRINLDIGHFTAGNFDAVAFLNENHAKITNLHLKDRKKDHGPNVTWGTGDTPIKEVLQLLKKSKWNIPANIEFETPGADLNVEIPKSLQYCKDALA